MTRTDLINLRLQNQQIALPALETSYQVGKWLGAVQAQDYLRLCGA